MPRPSLYDGNDPIQAECHGFITGSGVCLPLVAIVRVSDPHK